MTVYGEFLKTSDQKYLLKIKKTSLCFRKSLTLDIKNGHLQNYVILKGNISRRTIDL